MPSKQRSEAVRDQLLLYGVARERVNIVGYGDSVLEVEGTDDVSHARNRRVTATVVGYKGEVVKEWTILRHFLCNHYLHIKSRDYSRLFCCFIDYRHQG
ncbi:hypothetical protein HND97_10630 [Vibrio cholerae]|nr:hypothetical protein HND97_10630 [Vibrio cholerae]